MLHINIRSIPDHFLELTSLLKNLDIKLKIIAISETWLKPHHINYNIPGYNMEQQYRKNKRGGGVSLYLHNVLQYTLRNDLKIGNDPESINSIFVEIDKSTAGTKHNIIVGCVYRPPWVDLYQFNEMLNNMLDSLHTNHYIFLLSDFNVDLAHDAKTSLAGEEFKNIFATQHFFKSSKSIIDQIFCNIPYVLNMCKVGIIRTYISDHHAVMC